jgi:DNA-directed RNA polymerase subunit beta'
MKTTSFSKQFHVGTPFYITENTQIYSTLNPFIKHGELIGLIKFNQFLIGDIVQGLPQIEKILENRNTSNSAVLSNKNEFIIPQNNAKTFNLKKETKDKKIKSNSLKFTFANFIRLGQRLTIGPINLNLLLTIRLIYYLKNTTLERATYFTLKGIQISLINQIQQIYIKQKILISTKHIEILISILTSKIKILNDFSYTFMIGEILEFINICHINVIYMKYRIKKIYYKPLILGISLSSKYHNSFLSASSFKQMTKILAESAIEGRTD